MNFQMFKLVLEKAEEPEIKLPTSNGSSKKQERSRKTYFCFIDYAKAFDCVDHNKLWKILKDMGIPDHLTCLLRNLYAGQEATIRTGNGTTDWLQMELYQYLSNLQWYIIHQSCVLSHCLFNLYARVHHETCWAGWSTSCSKDCWGKYKIILQFISKKKTHEILHKK